MIRFILLFALLIVVGAVSAAEVEAAATAVVTPEVDKVATWAGIVTIGAGALAVILTGIAMLIRAFKPDSSIAAILEAIARFFRAVGPTTPSNIK